MQIGVLLLLGLAGLLCGFVTADWNTAFLPKCGEDCSAAHSSLALVMALFEVFAFVLLGYLLKAWKSLRRFVVVLAGLCLLTISSSYGLYRYWLLQSNPANDKVFVDQEFSTVVRLEKAIPELGLSQGERCAMGSRFCDEAPRVIEFHCKGKAMKVAEPFWHLFKRLPQEDWPGARPELYGSFPENVCGESKARTL